MLDEDDHNAYKNPHGMSILRGFALNLWQLFFNKHKGHPSASTRHFIKIIKEK
jgi:hypothetical protein